jgi:hypothetical protein
MTSPIRKAVQGKKEKQNEQSRRHPEGDRDAARERDREHSIIV